MQRGNILVDVDNTLVTTYATAIRRLNYLRSRHNVVQSVEYLYALVPHPARKKLLGEVCSESEHFWADYELTRRTMPPEPVGDVQRFVGRVRQEGFGFGVLTNNGVEKTLGILQRCGLSETDIDLFLHRDNLPFLKPDGRCFSGTKAALYIGDDIVDFIAANEAGVPFRGVLTGETTREDFLASGLEESRIYADIHAIRRFI